MESVWKGAGIQKNRVCRLVCFDCIRQSDFFYWQFSGMVTARGFLLVPRSREAEAFFFHHKILWCCSLFFFFKAKKRHPVLIKLPLLHASLFSSSLARSRFLRCLFVFFCGFSRQLVAVASRFCHR